MTYSLSSKIRHSPKTILSMRYQIDLPSMLYLDRSILMGLTWLLQPYCVIRRTL
ncbi:hypothetical protein Plhal304r1_c089g0171011 [Plasmopara halstedii]